MNEMSLTEQVKQERTLPVSARVDLVNLARMDLYYQTQGMYIKTTSQLVNWCVDLLCEVLIANDAMPLGKINSLADAVNYLRARGLMQVKTNTRMDRGRQKLGAALRFETYRDKGHNPKDKEPRSFGELHRKDSVTPPPSMGVVHRSKEEVVAEAMKAARESGLIVGDDFASDDEWIKASQERDKKIAEQENAPIKPGDLKVVDE